MARDREREIVVTVKHAEVEVKVGSQAAVTAAFVNDATRRETIELFDEWLGRNEYVTPRLVKLLGRHLFHMLFDGDALSALTYAIDAERDRGGDNLPLRIQLAFQDHKDLARLPWEFMYWDRGSRAAPVYFGTEPLVSLCRFMELGKKRDELEIADGELRLLLVVSRPDPEQSKLHRVDETKVVEALETARSELARRDPPIAIKVEKLDVATAAALTECVRSYRPHIVHFIGHGQFKDGGGEIALVESDGVRVQWCPDERFAQYVTPNRTPAPLLVVLHMCQGAVVDFERSFRGMAPQLILRGVPAVVAMQYSIPDIDAQLFSAEFYRRLGEGLPVDAAVQSARFLMSAQTTRNARGFGTPVLYLHGIDGVIRQSKMSDGDARARDPSVPKPQSNVPSDPQANGSASSKAKPEPAAQSLDGVAERRDRPGGSTQLATAMKIQLWKVVMEEVKARNYDPQEASRAIGPITKLESLDAIRVEIEARISNGPVLEPFYELFVRMVGVFIAEKAS
jgi:hypothetical protein